MGYGFETGDAPTITPGGQTSVAIRKRNLLAGLILDIAGTYTMTGGAGAGTFHTDGIYRIIRQVVVQARGSALQTVTGQTLRIIDKMGIGAFTKTQTQPTSVAAGASQAFRLRLPIHLTMPHTFTPEAFGLPTDVASGPTLFVNTGYAADMMTGENGTPALTGISAQLYEIPASFGVRPGSVAPFMIFTTEVPLASTVNGSKLYLDSLAPGMELRAVIVEAFSGGTNGGDYTYADNVVTRMTLNVNGEDKIIRAPWDLISQRNPSIYGWGGTEPGVNILDAAESRRTEPGALWTIRSGRPYLEYDATKQAGENMVRVTQLVTAGRAA